MEPHVGMYIAAGNQDLVYIALDLPSRAVLHLPLAALNDEYDLDIVVPAAYVKLGENARSAIATISEAVKVVFSAYDT